MSRAVATLPPEARAAFKEPFGPVYTDAERLLSDAGDGPLIAVGDVVSAHLGREGVVPHVSVVDGRTEREAVDASVLADLPAADREVDVESDPGTVSADLLEALAAAIDAPEGTTTRIDVDGEEDLATVPAILLAPVGATVVYGQPGEGMVRVAVTSNARERMRALAGELETTAEFWSVVD